MDELVRRDEKPHTLLELEQAALKIDLRYWERQQEKRDYGEPSHSLERHRSSRPSHALSTSLPPTSPFTCKQQVVENVSKSVARKLTQEEKKYRIDKKLCLYCGKQGHTFKDCPRSKPNIYQPTATVKTNISSFIEVANKNKDSLKGASMVVEMDDDATPSFSFPSTIKDEKCSSNSSIDVLI